MPRTTAAVAAETSRRVLEDARAMFAAVGFSAASVDDIARRAGVTRGAVYHHYESKVGLFRAVAAAAQVDVAARVVAAAERHDDPRAQLRAGSHAFLDAITEGETARILLVEAPAALGWQAWRELDAVAGARELRDALDAVGATDADATAHLLNGAMNEAALWLAERRGDEQARTAAHAVLDRLLDAVAG